jgi:4-amino-4-deoxy-L-arabinose transferase-like glycosyltransferase
MRTPQRARHNKLSVENIASSHAQGRDRIGLRFVSTDATSKTLFFIWLVAVAARLICVNQPYVDHWSWRQSDVAAIARNFLQNGFRFGYPQIDWAGNAPGFVGTEFPILPFIAAVCYKFAGVHEWIGRIQTVTFFGLSLPFFFLLVRESFGSTAAVWATFFYGFAPVNIFAGRSFMPDVPSLSLAIIGLYYFLRWIERAEPSSFFVAAIAVSLSLLIKITNLVVFAPLTYLVVAAVCSGGNAKEPSFQVGPAVLDSGAGRRIPQWLALFAVVALIPSAIWYWHAHETAQNFYPHHFFGSGGIWIESAAWYWEIAQNTSTSSLTPALSAMALVGLFVRQRRARSYSLIFHCWLAAMIVFMIVAGYGNRHRWYQLPLVPITAAFAGAGCASIRSRMFSRLAVVTSSSLLAIAFLVPAFVYVRPFYESSAAQLRDAGLNLKRTTPPQALIVAADMGDPTIFYYANRKGWHFLENHAIYNGNPDDSEQAIENLARLRRCGATDFVFTKNTFWWMRSYPEFAEYLRENSTAVQTMPEFTIYRLRSAVR